MMPSRIQMNTIVSYFFFFSLPIFFFLVAKFYLFIPTYCISKDIGYSQKEREIFGASCRPYCKWKVKKQNKCFTDFSLEALIERKLYIVLVQCILLFAINMIAFLSAFYFWFSLAWYISSRLFIFVCSMYAFDTNESDLMISIIQHDLDNTKVFSHFIIWQVHLSHASTMNTVDLKTNPSFAIHSI